MGVDQGLQASQSEPWSPRLFLRKRARRGTPGISRSWVPAPCRRSPPQHHPASRRTGRGVRGSRAWFDSIREHRRRAYRGIFGTGEACGKAHPIEGPIHAGHVASRPVGHGHRRFATAAAGPPCQRLCPEDRADTRMQAYVSQFQPVAALNTRPPTAPVNAPPARPTRPRVALVARPLMGMAARVSWVAQYGQRVEPMLMVLWQAGQEQVRTVVSNTQKEAATSRPWPLMSGFTTRCSRSDCHLGSIELSA
jgi:hypothetical protein